MIWRCKRCTGTVELNFDHVGPKCPTECSGTFVHKISLVDGKRCDLAYETLTHAQVHRG